jgi:GNAT superfamily N-acetyltransferase
MTEDLHVRSMESRDAQAVAELAGELGYARTADDVRGWLAAVGDGGAQAAFVAEADGRVVGWVEACLERRIQSEPYALIGGLVVREGVRGQRIGRRLCEAAEQWARGQGVMLSRVTSRSTREDAHRFYLRDGYAMVKTSVVFEKRLDA